MGCSPLGSILTLGTLGFPFSIMIRVPLKVQSPPTLGAVLDALEARYPVLPGTIRDQMTMQRRPFVRFFACKALC